MHFKKGIYYSIVLLGQYLLSIPGECTPCNINNDVVEPTITHVTTQPTIVFINILQLIPEHVFIFSKAPTPTVAPTWQWVVDNGIFRRLPIIITNAELSSIATPLDGVILHNFTPIA